MKPLPAENLFLEDRHAASRRFAVLEDDGTSAWLYLTEPDSRKPVADAWVYNRIAPPLAKEIEQYRGGPPPAAEGYVTDAAQCLCPRDHDWTFFWSSDGEAVTVSKDGEPVAFIVNGQRRGYSRELVKDGPWGHPWSDDLFERTFAKS